MADDKGLCVTWHSRRKQYCVRVRIAEVLEEESRSPERKRRPLVHGWHKHVAQTRTHMHTLQKSSSLTFGNVHGTLPVPQFSLLGASKRETYVRWTNPM